MCHLATLGKMSCCDLASQTRLDSLAAQPPNRCRVSATPPSASSCVPCVTYIPLTSYPIGLPYLRTPAQMPAARPRLDRSPHLPTAQRRAHPCWPLSLAR